MTLFKKLGCTVALSTALMINCAGQQATSITSAIERPLLKLKAISCQAHKLCLKTIMTLPLKT